MDNRHDDVLLERQKLSSGDDDSSNSIFYSTRYENLMTRQHMLEPFEISRQDRNASILSPTGRHLKDDKNRASVAQQYLDDFYLVNQLMVERHSALGLPLNPIPPGGVTDLGWAQSGPRGGGSGRGGHGGGQMTFQDCGKPSINWYNGKIIDTGNPQAHPFSTAPGSFNRMGPIYQNNNVTIANGVTSVIPAQNGVATGKPQSATQCGSQWSGFDYGGFYGSPSGYYDWNWYLLHPFLPALKFATDYATASGGFASQRNSGGGGSSSNGNPFAGVSTRGGLCPDNTRLIRAQIQVGGQWKNFMAVIDTGTPNSMLGPLFGGRGGGGSMGGGGMQKAQMRFDPNPQSISIPYDPSRNQGQNYVPAYYISKLVNICITSQYTICQSRGAGGTVTYNCKSNQIQSGDVLGNKEWGQNPLQAEVPSLSPQYNPKAKGFFREEYV
jgi:hypothetical protein